MHTKLEQYILNLEDRAVAQYGLDNRRTRLIYRYTAFLPSLSPTGIISGTSMYETCRKQ